MNGQLHPVQQSWVSSVLTIAAIAIVVALRMRSMSRERPLKLETLWVVPVVYFLVALSTLYTLWPSPLGWGLLSAGLGLGIAIGWHRGKLIRIERNPETGELCQRASPLALVLLLGIIALKIGARAIFGESVVARPGSSPMLVTDTFLGFAMGLLAATRLELYIRGRRMLANG